MATKVHHLIQPFPGTKDLYTLLDVINNKTTYESALTHIEAARKQANDTIERIAPATEIESLRAEAGRLHEQAQQILRDANATAEKIINDAGIKALSLETQSIQREKELDQRLKDFDDYRSVRTSELDSTAEKLKEKEKSLAERERLSSEMFAKANAVREEYEAKLAKFKRATAEIG